MNLYANETSLARFPVRETISGIISARQNQGVDRVFFTCGDSLVPIPTKAQKYHLFSRMSTCVCCGRKGSMLSLERTFQGSEHTYHLNLYAVKRGRAMLMTKDHIIPKSLGGQNYQENYQTMCLRCNHKKGNTATVEKIESGEYITYGEKEISFLNAHSKKVSLIRFPVGNFFKIMARVRARAIQGNYRVKKVYYALGSRTVRIKIRSQRYRLFQKNLNCVCCGRKGNMVSLDRVEDADGYVTHHFNLFHLEDGVATLMTKDHIIPKSKGGKNCFENLQTMCQSCNLKKRNTLEKGRKERGKLRKRQDL